MVGREKLNNEFIDEIILKHLRLNKRSLHRDLFIAIEGRNRDIRREAITRRINSLERNDRIRVLRKIGGENFYILGDG